MTAIVSPQPRLASHKHPQSPAVHTLSPPIYLATDLPRRNVSSGITSPPRLMSPIHLGDPMTYLSKAPPKCSPKRRRGHVSATARSARRRHPNRPDCTINYANGPSVFDQLSWISQLHDTPQCVDVWDIADLSLLPIEQPNLYPTSGVGPVRSRKSSLRSDPLASTSTPVPQDRVVRRSSPIPLLPLLDREVAAPCTPPPTERSGSANVQFCDLLPALPVYEGRR